MTDIQFRVGAVGTFVLDWHLFAEDRDGVFVVFREHTCGTRAGEWLKRCCISDPLEFWERRLILHEWAGTVVFDKFVLSVEFDGPIVRVCLLGQSPDRDVPDSRLVLAVPPATEIAC